MNKKIALVLIMVLLVNMAAWAEDSGSEEEGYGTVIIILALVGLAALLVASALAEADVPDDGIKLASMQTVKPISNTGLNSILDILSHVEVGQTGNDKIYAGLRFQF